jgi:hypothetical protein
MNKFISKYITLCFSIILLLIVSSLSAQSKKFSKEMLENPREYAAEFEKVFNINETPVYKRESHNKRLLFENGYVKHKLKNTQAWPADDDNVVVTQIDIIFTKYPKDINYWRTNYYDLLANRIKAIIEMDSSLNSNTFEWNLILQTDCNTEPEAMKMFHGVAITYFLEEEFMKDTIAEIDETPLQNKEYFKEYNQKLENFINSQGGRQDSLIFSVFNRKPEWKNALVVMDWTGSMYQYGAQAVLWHSLNFESSGIKNFVFFNDGDETEDFRKEIGNTGGVYYAQAKNLGRLINTFYLVSKRGDGGDDPENDVEALIKGMNRFEDFDEIILIADNNSCIRDFSMISNLNVSVNIIVCGAERAINPQYVNLAYHTGGSIHTMEQDIEMLSAKLKDDELELLNQKYKLDEEQLFSAQLNSNTINFTDCEQYSTFNLSPPEARLDFIDENGGITDSTVYKVFQRHFTWDKSAVILDWTSPMYTSSAQAVLYHKVNRKKSGIRYFVFFNDGNRLPKHKKKIAKTGGVYYSKANNLYLVTKRFNYVVKRSKADDDNANNDLEAVLRAVKKYNEVNQFILVADNSTCIRDYDLLKLINVPIKVIITNIHGPINPQYINLAYKSGGSIHLIDDDIYNYVLKSSAKTKQSLPLGTTKYIINENDFFEFEDQALNNSFPCSKYINSSMFQRLMNRYF